jgi:hypothetical protein
MLGSDSLNLNSSSEKNPPELESNQGSSDSKLPATTDRFPFPDLAGPDPKNDPKLTLTTGRLKI